MYKLQFFLHVLLLSAKGQWICFIESPLSVALKWRKSWWREYKLLTNVAAASSPVVTAVLSVECSCSIVVITGRRAVQYNNISEIKSNITYTVTVRSLLPVHERGTAYHLTFEHLHHHLTRLRNIWNPTSFNCLSPACRACDYVYIDYVTCSRSSSCRLLRPINCPTYITLHCGVCENSQHNNSFLCEHFSQ